MARLLVGASLLVVNVLTFADRTERFLVQALMVGSVTTVLVLGISMIRFLDRPYQGADGIKPTQMAHTLQALEDARLAPAVPCDDTGRPSSS